MVHGVITVDDEVTWVDPLAALPQPEDDLTLQRTYPGAVSHGEVAFVDQGRRVPFTTTLPRRYGALGCMGGDVWANGGWYPQPLVEGELPVADWTVRVEAAGEVAVNGPDSSWSGRAERVSLTVLPDGKRKEMDGVTLLYRGPERPRRDAEVEALAQAAERELVVVEAPMFRRLARPGHDVLFLSDMAFRLWKPLYRYHRHATLVGIVQASSAWEDPWLREVEGAAVARELNLGDDALRLMRFGAWLPIIDQLMYSGRLSFHAEVFDETFPADPLDDDVAEMFSARIPGRVLATKLDDTYGPGTALAVAEQGWEAVDPAFVESWRVPYPEQDLRLEVDRQQLTITRDAPADAPAEPIPYTIDGERHVWDAPAGPGEHTQSLDGLSRVALDPKGHVRQTSRLYDTWPTRWTATFAGGPETVNLSEGIFVGSALTVLRRQYDTHNTFHANAWTGERSRLAVGAGYSRRFGPLVDRRRRRHRIGTSVSAAWLNPDFRPTDDGLYAVEWSVGYSWDSRVAYHFPLRGQGVGVSADTGFVPGSGARWGSVGAGGAALWAPHPRTVLALRARGGLAFGDVEHRLFSLGGSSMMRGLAPGVVVGTDMALGALELRLQPLRNASIPLMWVYWLDELQLNGGLEAGTVGGESALGWTAGFRTTMDGLGAVRWTWGLTVAQPVWTSFEADTPVQAYLRFGQEF